MKRSFSILGLLIVFFVFFVSCGKDDPVPAPVQPESDTTSWVLVDTFARKHLIEQFTGEWCGNCPRGVVEIKQFIDSNLDKKFVWVSHHYQSSSSSSDRFHNAGSVAVIREFGVGSYPSTILDRTTWSLPKGSVFILDPHYLTLTKDLLKTRSTVSFSIENNFDAVQNKLTVTVRGRNGSLDSKRIAVLVKENGLMGVQADYGYTSWKGWLKYCHSNVTRCLLTSVKGDALPSERDTFLCTYTKDWDASWNANNSMVVVIVSDSISGEVLNVDEAPVIANTDGGVSIKDGGVEQVPVAYEYPEIHNFAYDNQEIEFSRASYYLYDDKRAGYNMIRLILENQDVIVSVNRDACTPILELFLLVPKNVTSLPSGSFSVDSSYNVGTVESGYRIDSLVTFAGSKMWLATTEALNEGYLDGYLWYLKEGTLTISGNIISIVATPRTSGITIKGKFEGEFENLDEKE